MLPWRQPLGATPRGDGSVEFRVWALKPERVAVRVRGADHPLADAGYGVREAVVEAAPGDDYWFVLDGEALPDPASRHQPEGLRGPSRVVDAGALEVTPLARAPAPAELVLYELHVGTFSAEGTFDGAIPHLDGLAELGVNAIEVMPIAEFPGRHGWGYDGVYLSAAHSAYGGPEGFARLVDAAHRRGIAVVLDVVYNHVGASGGDALRAYGPYFTEKYSTFWGDAINYDDEWADPVREWVLQSAAGWVRDFGVDGLRLDAIHAIYDTSAKHVLRELTDRVHALARASTRSMLVIAESGLNDPRVVRPDGLGCDAVWADDFHHALRALLTGEREGYYEEYGTVAQLADAFRRPVLHTGQWSTFRKRSFGAPHDDIPPERFVVFASNHDQVGNRALGDRLPEPVRPLAAFCALLSPFVPMLFMGEEYGEPAPFQFFSDHIDEEIATATREGRRREFAAFAQFAGEEVPDPQDPATFARSKLSREGDEALRDLYARLLRARRELAGEAETVALSEEERWLAIRRGEHLLAINLADVERTVPLTSTRIVLGTHDGIALHNGVVTLPPLAGALLR